MYRSSVLCSFLCLCLGSFQYATEIHSNSDDKTYVEFLDRHGQLRISPLEETKNVPNINPENDIQFHLFTRFGTPSYILIVGDLQNLQASIYNSHFPTKILIHGFQADVTSEIVTSIKDSYLIKGDYNVIGVDWSGVSDNLLYPVVVAQVPQVGHHISRLVDFLVHAGGAKLSDIHIIGHSLGGHVAGFAGANVSVGLVGRISGLDPSGPLFEMHVDAPSKRLDPSDAVFVDVIHTCKKFLGIGNSIGHVDFYPNGGFSRQPGCEVEDLTSSGSCSHQRSYKYFAESILSNGFVAKQCSSWIHFKKNECSNNFTLMGDPIDQRFQKQKDVSDIEKGRNGYLCYLVQNVNICARGDYYLRTHSSPPFAQGVLYK